MRKASGVPVTGAISRGVPPLRIPAPAVRPSRGWWWALAGLIGLTTAGQVGLIVAAGSRLRGAATGAGIGTAAPVPGSGGARSPASGDPAVARGVATALRGPAPEPDGPPGRPVDSGAPRPPRDDGLPPAAGPPEAANPPEADARSLGRELFAREWQPDDPNCHGGDGLGPVYNATSCLGCHNLGGPGGAGPARENVQLVTGTGFILTPKEPVVIDGVTYSSMLTKAAMLTKGFLMRAAPERADLVKIHPGFRKTRSTVLHRFGVDPNYSRWREAFRTSSRDREAFATPILQGLDAQLHDLDGQVVVFRISPHDKDLPGVVGGSWLADGKGMPAEVREGMRTALGSPVVVDRVALSITTRNAPPLFGAGLIDALSDATLENVASQQPIQIRGRVHRLKNGQIGRFGWKAQVATLEDFVLTACANELGLEVPGHHQAASPLNPDAEARALDLTQAECNALVSYVRSLPAPVVVASSPVQASHVVEDGRRVFQSIGCAGCHTPDLGTIRGIYSDLLLHDMGQELKDAGAYYDELDDPGSSSSSRVTEWRTPPLWGFRDSGPYLHDGRAQTLEEAVAMHGAQGAASRHRFQKLTWQERSQVRAFLETLGEPGADGAPRVVRAVETEAPAVQPRSAAPTPAGIQVEEAMEFRAPAVQPRSAAPATRRAANRLHARRHTAPVPERQGLTRGALDFDQEPVQEALAPLLRPVAAERINVPGRKSDQEVVGLALHPLHPGRRAARPVSILGGDSAGDPREREAGAAVPATGQR